MLNHFIHPATISTGQPIEGVQAVKGYTPYNRLHDLLPAFQMPDEGGKAEDEQKKNTPYLEDHSTEELSGLPEIFKLAINVSFKELFRYFFTPNHEQILNIRQKLYSANNEDELVIFVPRGKVPKRFQSLRDYLYEVQMQLFQTKKGLHCHLILFEQDSI